MSKYELHPVVFEYPDFTPDERERMKADLKANGQRMPILLWQDQIVDGRHRDALLRELDIEPVFASPLAGASEAEMRAFVASLNVHRRSRTERLTNAEKEARVEAELRKDHTRSNNAIAKATGVSDKTVAKIRKKLEDNFGIPKLTETVGDDGKARPARRPPAEPPEVSARDREAIRTLSVLDPDAVHIFNFGEGWEELKKLRAGKRNWRNKLLSSPKPRRKRSKPSRMPTRRPPPPRARSRNRPSRRPRSALRRVPAPISRAPRPIRSKFSLPLASK